MSQNRTSPKQCWAGTGKTGANWYHLRFLNKLVENMGKRPAFNRQISCSKWWVQVTALPRLEENRHTHGDTSMTHTQIQVRFTQRYKQDTAIRVRFTQRYKKNTEIQARYTQGDTGQTHGDTSRTHKDTSKTYGDTSKTRTEIQARHTWGQERQTPRWSHKLFSCQPWLTLYLYLLIDLSIELNWWKKKKKKV